MTQATSRAVGPKQVRAVSPTLEAHTQERVVRALWDRPALTKRDRALVTLATLIAGGQAGALATYAAKALDHGVASGEISELVLHLAYYAGWGQAIAATAPIAAVFTERGVGEGELPAVEPDLLPLDEQAEERRRDSVGAQFGEIAPGLVDYTTDYLFRDLWRRPGLAPRERSLTTVAALVAMGQVQQITFRLGRAMDNGLTAAEAGEVLTHLALYAGWLRAMSALPVVKQVMADRAGGSPLKDRG